MKLYVIPVENSCNASCDFCITKVRKKNGILCDENLLELSDLESKSILFIGVKTLNNIPCFHLIFDLLNGCVEVSFIRHPFITPLFISEFVM